MRGYSCWEQDALASYRIVYAHIHLQRAGEPRICESSFILAANTQRPTLRSRCLLLRGISEDINKRPQSSFPAPFDSLNARACIAVRRVIMRLSLQPRAVHRTAEREISFAERGNTSAPVILHFSLFFSFPPPPKKNEYINYSKYAHVHISPLLWSVYFRSPRRRSLCL